MGIHFEGVENLYLFILFVLFGELGKNLDNNPMGGYSCPEYCEVDHKHIMEKGEKIMAYRMGEHLMKRAMQGDMDRLREEERLSPVERARNFGQQFSPESGEDVLKLQKLLNKSEIGDYENLPLKEDAIFGPRTESSLRNLQDMPPERPIMGVGEGLGPGLGGMLGKLLGSSQKNLRAMRGGKFGERSEGFEDYEPSGANKEGFDKSNRY